MGRKKIISKEEVYEFLREGRWTTAAQLAAHFGVTTSTIRERVRELLRDDVPVLAGPSGYCIMKTDDVTDTDVARSIERIARYMIGTVARQAMIAKPVRRLMTEARKLLPKDQTERAIVRKYLVQLTHMIDFDDADQEAMGA